MNMDVRTVWARRCLAWESWEIGHAIYNICSVVCSNRLDVPAWVLLTDHATRNCVCVVSCVWNSKACKLCTLLSFTHIGVELQYVLKKLPFAVIPAHSCDNVATIYTWGSWFCCEIFLEFELCSFFCILAAITSIRSTRRRLSVCFKDAHLGLDEYQHPPKLETIDNAKWLLFDHRLICNCHFHARGDIVSRLSEHHAQRPNQAFPGLGRITDIGKESVASHIFSKRAGRRVDFDKSSPTCTLVECIATYF